MADVVYLVSDMLFSSKIRETAKPFGLTLQGLRDPAALAAAAAAGAKLVILDLRLPAALDALAALAADPVAAAVPSVGFIDQNERREDEARARGCGQVMAKGQFANALPRLLAPLVPPPPPSNTFPSDQTSPRVAEASKRRHDQIRIPTPRVVGRHVSNHAVRQPACAPRTSNLYRHASVSPARSPGSGTQARAVR